MRGASHFDSSEGNALTLRLRLFLTRSISAPATRRLSNAAAQVLVITHARGGQAKALAFFCQQPHAQ
jgi:hypothetical protein